MTLPLARRSAIRVPRRDLVVGAGDALALRVRLVEEDRHGAAAVDLRRTFARVRMHVWRDASPLGRSDYGTGWSGPVLSSRSAMASEALPGACEIELRAEDTWTGRMGWSLQADLLGAEHALCWGALHVRPALDMPALHVLTGDGEHALDGQAEHVVL